MYKLHKQALAEEDLRNIWLFSYKQWGEAQADKYFDDLAAAINALCDNPLIGKSCDNLRKGYRSIHINRHIVYYTIESTVIRVVRVLHERMDIETHL